MEQRTLRITKTMNNSGLPRYSLSERIDGKRKRVCWVEGIEFDVEGSLIADWLRINFRDHLKGIDKAYPGLSFYDPDYYNSKKKYHRGPLKSPVPYSFCVEPTLEGGFGFESMQRIAAHIGITIVRGKKPNEYLVTIQNEGDNDAGK